MRRLVVMTCQSCGKNLPAGARYCIHCGAELALPTPIAVVAAAMGSRGRREAANAAHAEPVEDDHEWGEPHGQVPPRSSASPAAPPPPEASLSDDDAGDSPVYASTPARHGLAAALIVACLAVGIIGGTAAWWWYAVRERVANPAAAVQAPRSTAATQAAVPPPASETAPNAATPGAPEIPGPNDADASTPPGPEQAEATPPPVEIMPLPAHRAPSRVAKGAPPAREPKAAAPATESPAPPHPAVVAAPSPPPVTVISDRWARMDQDLSRCTREDFIARVVCTQRVRFRYCDGYWGKVAACPGNPTPERGQ